MSNLPTGTVTFLFTDIEGSTKLWEQRPDEMRAALVRHDELIEHIVTRSDGALVRPPTVRTIALLPAAPVASIRHR